MMKMRILGGGQFSWGIDACDEVVMEKSPGYRWRVLNYTHRWFSPGASTSGHGMIGVSWHGKGVHRRVKNPNYTHGAFDGWLIQAWMGLFKVYLYVYFKGDGLGPRC